METITKCFFFEASHQLPDYDGPCGKLHGHTYELHVTITGEKNKETGMIMDFKILKEIVERYVLSKFDHAHLNDFMENPTVENIGRWVVATLMHQSSYPLKLHSVKLYETRTCWYEWIETSAYIPERLVCCE